MICTQGKYEPQLLLGYFSAHSHSLGARLGCQCTVCIIIVKDSTVLVLGRDLP